jgi:CubicO group peptidase (beta-lactamase class C family)
MEKLVQDFLDERVAARAEVGLQVAVYRDGAQIVDAVAGVAAPDGRAVASDTLFYGVSLGKALTSTIAVVLVDKGVFGYDTRVADIWPEYAAHGKGSTTIRHVLTQTAGVPGVPADTTPEALTDWDRMVSTLADAEPWWEPGTRSGYHALSYGYLLGEIMRRATGESLGSLLRAHVSGPLGVADELFFGVPASARDRIARLVPGPVLEGWDLPDDHPIFRMAPPAVQPSAELYNRDDILAADIPAGAGDRSAVRGADRRGGRGPPGLGRTAAGRVHGRGRPGRRDLRGADALDGGLRAGAADALVAGSAAGLRLVGDVRHPRRGRPGQRGVVRPAEEQVHRRGLRDRDGSRGDHRSRRVGRPRSLGGDVRFSPTAADWNTTLVRDDLAGAIDALKQRDGKDMLLTGGLSLAGSQRFDGTTALVRSTA